MRLFLNFNRSLGNINVLIYLKGINKIDSLVTHILLIFKGVREVEASLIKNTIK